MKKFWTVLALLAVGAGIYFFEKPPPARVSSGSPSADTAPKKPENTPAAAPDSTAPSRLAASAAAPPAPDEIRVLPPPTVLDNARVAVQNYNAAFGENPVGTNPEITAALTGNNPKQINFISPAAGLRVNEKGELLDAWGTPFFFHQVSGQEMEVRSAGADRKMWTFDDLVTRSSGLESFQSQPRPR